MPRKSYRKKHQRGGGCGCGGTSVLGFPQSGGQMNSIIGSSSNTQMNDVPMDVPRNTSMNAPRNTNMNARNNTYMNAPRNNTYMNAPRNNTYMNAPRNTESTMSFNSGPENNNPFLSASNIMGGGFLGMFDSQQQQQQQNTGISPQNIVNQPRITNQSNDVNTRIGELENRLKKLEVGGSFFGGKRHLRHKSKKATRKHKKTRKH